VKGTRALGKRGKKQCLKSLAGRFVERRPLQLFKRKRGWKRDAERGENQGQGSMKDHPDKVVPMGLPGKKGKRGRGRQKWLTRGKKG